MQDISKYQPGWVELGRINMDNTRFRFRQRLDTDELAASLKDEGQKFPVVLWDRGTNVTPRGSATETPGDPPPGSNIGATEAAGGPPPGSNIGGGLQIICGFTRCAAAKSLGWDKVMAVTIPESDLGEEEALKLSFIENERRRKLSEPDLAYTCGKLSGEKRSNREIARLVGIAESSVRNYLKVLSLPQDVQARFAAGEISLRDVLDMSKVRNVAHPGNPDPMPAGYYTRKVESLKGLPEFISYYNEYRASHVDVPMVSESWQGRNTYIKPVKGGFQVTAKFLAGKGSLRAMRERLVSMADSIAELEKGMPAAAAPASAPTPAATAGGGWESVGGGAELPDDMPQSVKDMMKSALDQMNSMMPTAFGIFAAPSEAEPLSEIALAPGETVNLYAKCLVAGQWYQINKDESHITWQASPGLEISPLTGGQVSLKLSEPFGGSGTAAVSSQLPTGKTLSCEVRVKSEG